MLSGARAACCVAASVTVHLLLQSQTVGLALVPKTKKGQKSLTACPCITSNIVVRSASPSEFILVLSHGYKYSEQTQAGGCIMKRPLQL